MDVVPAIIVVVILLLLDNIFTYKILSMYRIYHPDNKDWANLEINNAARSIFKKYGLGKRSFMMNVMLSVIITLLFFGMAYMFDFDLKFFVYASFGGLTTLNYIHYDHYKRLKEKLEKKDLWTKKEL